MNEYLALLIVLNVLVIVCFGVLFIGILIIARETMKMPEIISRLLNIESLTQQLVSDVGFEMSSIGKPTVFRSADGKYEASSFEELLQLMSGDPNSSLTKEDLDTIKALFQKFLQDQQDDDDDPPEDWKKR